MTIHKDIHFKYDDVIDNAAESSFTVWIVRDNALFSYFIYTETYKHWSVLSSNFWRPVLLYWLQELDELNKN